MYRSIITDHFKKQLKYYIKKDPLLSEYLQVELLLFKKETSIAVGNNLFKLRVKGFNKGKSGGYRLFLFLVEVRGIIIPIHIYSKNHKKNATHKEIVEHLEIIKAELNL